MGMGFRILWSARFAGFGAVLCGGLPCGGACWRCGRLTAPGGGVRGRVAGGAPCERWRRLSASRRAVGPDVSAPRRGAGARWVCPGSVLRVMRRGVCRFGCRRSLCGG